MKLKRLGLIIILHENETKHVFIVLLVKPLTLNPYYAVTSSLNIINHNKKSLSESYPSGDFYPVLHNFGVY